MTATFIVPDGMPGWDNHARLNVVRISETELKVEHTNTDDDHYTYRFSITGTKEELDVIERFASLLNNTSREE